MDGFLRILVAEENEVDSFVIQCELSKLDMAFTFKRVASYNEYFSQLEEFQPNLVLANNSFDGEKIIHYTRTTFPKVPVVMIVNTTQESVVQGLLQKGATDCLLRRQLPQLKTCVEKVIKHCQEHQGEAVPKPTCYDIAAVQKKSFLDRYFGVPARPVEVTTKGNQNVEHGASISTRIEAPVAGDSFGTRLARIRKKFCTAATVGAEEPALEARTETQTVLAVNQVAIAATIGTGGGVPANPSIAGAGSSSLLDGMEVPTIPSPFGSRTELETSQLAQLGASPIDRNVSCEHTSSEPREDRDVSSLVRALDQNIIRLQSDLAWVTEQLSKKENGMSRKQLLDLLDSTEEVIGESVRGIQNISGELARWVPNPSFMNAEKNASYKQNRGSIVAGKERQS